MEAGILRETIEKIDEIFGGKKADPIKKSDLDQKAFVKYATRGQGAWSRYKPFAINMVEKILSEMKDDDELGKSFPALARVKAKQYAEDFRIVKMQMAGLKKEMDKQKNSDDAKAKETAKRLDILNNEIRQLAIKASIMSRLSKQAIKYKQ